MSELTGEDAFDKVLEAAFDAHVNARQATDRLHAAEAAFRDAERVSERARASVILLENEKQNALPKLAELWQAAKAVSDFRATSPEKMLEGKILLERLKSALDAAAGYCDEIPF